MAASIDNEYQARQANGDYYDKIGRIFRTGVRCTF